MKYDKIVGLKKQQEKENLEIIQREIDAMLRRKERISITEEVNKQLKRQMILYKRRIKELELQIELLEEENQRLKENR